MLHLTFYYLMNLNIMTVKAKVTTATELITPISARYQAGAAGSGLREGGVTRTLVPGLSVSSLSGSEEVHGYVDVRS